MSGARSKNVGQFGHPWVSEHARYRTSTSAGSRWMVGILRRIRLRFFNLRYPGTCKVCGGRIPKGTRAYWDAGARTVTCASRECALTDGVATVVDRSPWAPDGRVEPLARRVGGER